MTTSSRTVVTRTGVQAVQLRQDPSAPSPRSRAAAGHRAPPDRRRSRHNAATRVPGRRQSAPRHAVRPPRSTARKRRSAMNNRHPDARLTARSAATQRATAESFSGREQGDHLGAIGLHSTPSAPWPAAGRLSSRLRNSRMRSASPSRCRPGPREQQRVEMPGVEFVEPRVHVAAYRQHVRSGRRASSCACRRKLDEPTRAPVGKLRDATPRPG